MPLKVVLKAGEKIIINGAVIENVGGPIRMLILNQAAVLRERDIVTETEAVTPASRIYFAVQNLYLFPGRDGTYRPIALQFLAEYLAAAPSAKPIIDTVVAEIEAGHLYNALRAVRDLIVHEGSVIDNAQQELSTVLQQYPAGGESAPDGSLGPDRGGAADEGGAKGPGK
jgi:flagellar protein FlbT